MMSQMRYWNITKGSIGFLVPFPSDLEELDNEAQEFLSQQDICQSTADE